jgi:hypothetical protein
MGIGDFTSMDHAVRPPEAVSTPERAAVSRPVRRLPRKRTGVMRKGASAPVTTLSKVAPSASVNLLSVQRLVQKKQPARLANAYAPAMESTLDDVLAPGPALLVPSRQDTEAEFLGEITIQAAVAPKHP